MEFDWTTFVLEIVNFLILLWILKRFLYQPVLNVIERRQAVIAQSLDEAEKAQHNAAALRQQYENRLADWEKEKEQAREHLREEIAQERERLMAALNTSLGQEREKAQVLEQRRQEELARGFEEQAISNGGKFVARLLSRLSGPELEARMVALLLQDIENLPAERQQELRQQLQESKESIRVVSAFAITDAQRTTLATALSHLVGAVVSPLFSEDPTLLAGLRISVGPWVLRANLKDELEYFTGVPNHAP